MGFYDFYEYGRLLDTAKDLGPTVQLVVLLGTRDSSCLAEAAGFSGLTENVQPGTRPSKALGLPTVARSV